MSAEAHAEVIQTLSKGAGLLSASTALTHPWWMIFPWADVAIIASCIGGFFFMIERFFSMRIKYREFREGQENQKDGVNS